MESTKSITPGYQSSTERYYRCTAPRPQSSVVSSTYDEVKCNIKKSESCNPLTNTSGSCNTAIVWDFDSEHLIGEQVKNCSSSCTAYDNLFLYGKVIPNQESTTEVDQILDSTIKDNQIAASTTATTTTIGSRTEDAMTLYNTSKDTTAKYISTAHTTHQYNITASTQRESVKLKNTFEYNTTRRC